MNECMRFHNQGVGVREVSNGEMELFKQFCRALTCELYAISCQMRLSGMKLECESEWDREFKKDSNCNYRIKKKPEYLEI